MSTVPEFIEKIIRTDILSLKKSTITPSLETKPNTINEVIIPYDLDKAQIKFDTIFNEVKTLRTEAESKGALSPEDLDKSYELSQRLRLAISEFMDAVKQNPSLITQTATQWGKLNWYEQLMPMVIFFAPLIGGFMILNPILLAIGFTGSAATAFFSWVLNDHYTKNQGVINLIEKGVLGIADIMILMIGAQAEQLKVLTKAVEQLKQENIKFAKEVQQLTTLREEYQKQIKELAQSNSLLRDDIKGMMRVTLEMEQQISSLSSQVGELELVGMEYSKQLEESKRQLNLLKEVKEEVETNLGKKIQELDAGIKNLVAANCSLNEEIDVISRQKELIEDTLKRMRSYAQLNEQQKVEFDKKIKEFLASDQKNKEFFLECNKEYQTTTKQLSSTKNELKEVTEKLELLQEDYKQLLESTKGQMTLIVREHGDQMNQMKNSFDSMMREVKHEISTSTVRGTGFFVAGNTSQNLPQNPQPPMPFK